MIETVTPEQTSEQPRYAQLAAELRAEILDRKFSANGNFPTESELCQRYGVSRFTVREALRRLQSEGLIARRRGSGTVVQPAAARGGALHQPLSNLAELLQYARNSTITFIPGGSRPLPKAVAAQIANNTQGNWSSYSGVRRHESDPLPIARIEVFFHPDLAANVPLLELGSGPLFGQIEQLANIAVGRVTQDIQALPAGTEVARTLGLRRGAAVLRILRCFYDGNGRLFEISLSHHPGERFAYSMHIEMDG